MLDFNDLEHLALQVLVRKRKIRKIRKVQSVAPWGKRMIVSKIRKKHTSSAAAKELSGQYEEILVDEYQDSNLVQETLIQQHFQGTAGPAKCIYGR